MKTKINSKGGDPNDIHIGGRDLIEQVFPSQEMVEFVEVIKKMILRFKTK